MDDYERLLWAYPLQLEWLRMSGIEALAIVKGGILTVVLVASIRQIFRGNSLLGRVLCAGSSVVSFVELTFLMIGLGSAIDLLTG